MSKFRQCARQRAVCVVVVAFASATAAPAQVIEIDDDGTARTFSAPTAFFGDQALTPSAAKVVQQPADGDRFERAAKAAGVDPQLLRAVAWTESRGRQSAVSPKGALGIMQLMPGTAAELGVNPFDPEANVHGGARYLASQLLRFQSVPLALAAYNAGPGAVLRWRGIPPYAETQAYVASIMARLGKPLTLPVATAAPVRAAARPAPQSVDSMLIEVPS